MNNSVTYNNKFVKKVSNITDLFTWSNSLEQGFPSLPIKCISVQDVVVNKPIGLNNKAYQHHALTGRKHGKLYVSHTIHDYDEDAGGMYVALNVSSDNGITWTELSPVLPGMSSMVAFGVSPAQWGYPSIFLDLPSGFYILITCVSSGTYTSIGTGVRKINSDNSYGNFLWVNNGISESSRVPSAPISGYPSYSFASESLINEVRYYINQPKYKPKILFGWNEIFITQGTFISDPLREPTTIQPYNYKEWLKVWRGTSNVYNIVQNGSDNLTQKISQIPNGAETTAKRFYNYSPSIIVIVGHSKDSTRNELMLCIARKNNSTGKYNIGNNDAYSLTDIGQSQPFYPGHEKFGGEQLVHINRCGKDELDIAFSVSKEHIVYKRVNISKLI